MAGPIRTRSACDRCHSQKLRCPKQPGSAACSRCSKARAACVYSPPGAKATSHDDAIGGSLFPNDPLLARAPSPEANGWAPAALDWALPDCDVDFGAFLATLPPNPVRYQLDSSPTQPPNPESQPSTSTPSCPAEGDNPKSSCTRKLTNLLLDVDKLWASLPPRSALHIPSDETLETFKKDFADKYQQKQLLEGIFVITQRLIEVHPSGTALSLALEPRLESPCETASCTHNFELPIDLKDVENQIMGKDTASSVDHALANLLVSCHLRLLDILDRVFMLAISCSRVTLAHPTNQEPDFDITELRVGSFVPRRGAAMVLMQMALLKHLLAILSKKLAQFSKAVSSVSSGDGSAECRILMLQCEALTERHGAKAGQLGMIEGVRFNELIDCVNPGQD